MKFLYGLIAFSALALVAIWLGGSPANDIQVDTSPVEVPEDVYDPIQAGEEQPPGFRQLLPRDAILPVYNPTFVSKEASDWDADTLIIGVTTDEGSKAYPVSFLTRREIVIDWIGGTPILVSW